MYISKSLKSFLFSESPPAMWLWQLNSMFIIKPAGNWPRNDCAAVILCGTVLDLSIAVEFWEDLWLTLRGLVSVRLLRICNDTVSPSWLQSSGGSQRPVAEASVSYLQISRLEGQVLRYKTAAENAEKVEDELKAEKRKLQREVLALTCLEYVPRKRKPFGNNCFAV